MRLKPRAEQSTLWPGARRASPRRWQGNGEALLTADGSGLSSSELCERLIPAGSWPRILSESLASSLRALTGSAVSLKVRATKSGRSLLVPTTLEPRTDESASGSWPTATATAYGNNRGGSDRNSPTGWSRTGKVRPRLWPTHTVSSHAQLAEDPYLGQTGGTTLAGEVLRQSGLWITPQARDWRSGAMTPEGHAHRMGHPRGPTLPEQIDCAGQLDRGNHSMSGRPQDWPTPRSERWGAPDSHGRAPIRGSLNPDWVAQLQGFPDGWLCPPLSLSDEWLHPATASRRSRRSETASSRRSRK